jgi:cytochrome P450
MSTATVFRPSAPEHRADPHPQLHRMRAEAPVYRHVNGAGTFWYLTRYADVQRALREPELARQLDRLPPEMAARHRRGDFDPLKMVRRNVFHLDPPDHTRLRRLMAPAFSPRRVAAIDRHLTRVVDELIDAMVAGGGPADVIASLALPLPALVVAELVGFPADDLGRLRWWSDEMSRSGHPGRVRRAGLEFIAYLTAAIDRRRADPGDDLLSELIQVDGDRLSPEELVAAVFQLLLAGDETTVNLIGNGVLELLRHPDQLARLRADPDLIDSAVEEMTRFNGPVGHSKPVYALSPLDFDGVVIPTGDTVVAVLLAANRDPAVFPSPDDFDLGRTPNRHLGFGHGIHFCLGAALARMQARVAIGTLVRRFPGLALAVDPAELQWSPDLFLHGVRRLPVRWKGGPA